MRFNHHRFWFLVLPAFLCAVVISSCRSDGKDYYGIVEMFHGRPVPPKTIPRHVIGPMPAGTLPSHTLQGIVVMDTGSDYDGISPMTYLSNMVDSYHSETTHKGDLPFHYFIDKNGHAYMGRNILSPGEIYHDDSYLLRSKNTTREATLRARIKRKSSPEYNVDGYIIICVLGDYDETLLTKEQEQMLYQTIAYLVYQHNIPFERIHPLHAVIPESNNPGFYLNNYLQTSILQENIPPAPGEHRFLNPNPRAGVW